MVPKKSPDEVARKNRQVLNYYCLRFQNEISACIAKIDKVPEDSVTIRAMSPKLLTLKIWSIRYRVPLCFILSTLLHAYRKIRRTQRPGLGISIYTLCGKSAQRILEETILREFPAGENERLWEAGLEKRFVQAMGASGSLPADTFRDAVATAPSLDQAVKEYEAALVKFQRSRTTVQGVINRRPWMDNLKIRS